MTFSFFQWLSGTWLSQLIGGSVWAFATIEMIHLLGLALLGGAALILNLRLLGVRLARRPASEVARELSPLFLAGLVTLVISGVLLVCDGPMRYYGNPAFRIKMLLLIVASVFSFLLHRRVIHAGHVSVSGGARVSAILSLTLWLGVGLAGRIIGFIA